VKKTPDFSLPGYARDALRTLRENGYEAYLVGGCVRDLFLGRRPFDYDIATSARPEETMKLFPSAHPTGIRHGTVTVVIDGHPMEITTFRSDGAYSDGRRPDSVSFSADIAEDLRRRDFTVNAMAWSDKGGLLDPFGGRRDLDAKIIRCVGDPFERFYEDPLRILRAWRFSGELGFEIERDTAAAARKLKGRLELISAERIHAELLRILLSKRADALVGLINAGFLGRFGVACAPDALLRLSQTDADLRLRAVTLAVFLERAGCLKSADGFLFSLRFDKSTVALSKTVRKMDLSFETELEIKKAVADYGPEAVLCCASVFFLVTGENAPELVGKIRESGECLTLSELRLGGDDLKRIGITDGKEIGRILKEVLVHVLSHPEDNKPEKLTILAKSLIL